MRIWKMIGLGLLVATFWTATGFSFPHDGMGGDGAGLGGPGLWHLLRALNLTDHYAFKSGTDLALIMYFNSRSMPGRQYYLSTNARYELHVSKAASKTAP